MMKTSILTTNKYNDTNHDNNYHKVDLKKADIRTEPNITECGETKFI